MTSKIIKELQDLAVPMKDLVLLDPNPRRGDVPAVARSLKRFAQRKPLVVHRDTKVIEAGNTTFLAAEQLGWDEIAAVFIVESETEGKAFSLADNRTAELGYVEEEELLVMLQDVFDADQELLEAASYTEEDILALLGEDGDDDDDGPIPSPVISYNLIFDTEEQQRRFYAFVRWLKSTYPDHETVAERLNEFIQDQDIE